MKGEVTTSVKLYVGKDGPHTEPNEGEIVNPYRPVRLFERPDVPLSKVASIRALDGILGRELLLRVQVRDEFEVDRRLGDVERSGGAFLADADHWDLARRVDFRGVPVGFVLQVDLDVLESSVFVSACEGEGWSACPRALGLGRIARAEDVPTSLMARVDR